MSRRPIFPLEATTLAGLALLMACGGVPEDKPSDESVEVVREAQRQAELEAQHQAELSRLRAEYEKGEREKEDFREHMRQQQVIENSAKAASLADQKTSVLAAAAGCNLAREQQKHFQDLAQKTDAEYKTLLTRAKRLGVLRYNGSPQHITAYWTCSPEQGRTIIAQLNDLKEKYTFEVEQDHAFAERVEEACPPPPTTSTVPQEHIVKY